MRITGLILVSVAALAAGHVSAGWWLGPAGGVNRAGGDTGYISTVESPPVDARSALWWGLASGYERDRLAVSGRGVVFPRVAEDGVGYAGSAFHEETLDYHYREENVALAADLRPEADFRPAFSRIGWGARAAWLHAARHDAVSSPWGGGGVFRIYDTFVNDVFLGVGPGVGVPAGPLEVRAALVPGWRGRNEYVVKAERIYEDSGRESKRATTTSVRRDFVTAQAEVGATWFLTRRFRLAAWDEGRIDLYNFRGGDDAPRRWDLTVGVAPAVNF